MRRMIFGLVSIFALFGPVSDVATAQDLAYPILEKAYTAQRTRQYDQAITLFRQAIAANPDKPGPRKDLAYTYLKVGQTAAARDEFLAAWRLAPQDYHVALEYAFLCYETKQPVEARRTFDRIRHEATGPERLTAEKSFQNIDQPLAANIARWQQALASSPDNYSAHVDLATLAEQRDELRLAAEHFEAAFKLKPGDYELLLHLGRVWAQLGQTEPALAAKSRAALVAASRCPEPRTAERARELMPDRYPYTAEFRDALQFLPASVELRRELAYLLLAVNQKPQAEAEFDEVVKRNPKDLVATAQLGLLRLARDDRPGALPLLKTVMEGENTELANRVRSALGVPPVMRRVMTAAPAPEPEPAPIMPASAQASTPAAAPPPPPPPAPAAVSADARTLAFKSLEAGYLNDALKYLQIAHENDPTDFEVMLKLGWAYNILHQDDEAVKWFGLARRSPDPKVAAEAERAHRNLKPDHARVRTTTWANPMFSTRWHDAFAYGQTKMDVRLGHIPLRPYLSVRFVGDTRGSFQASSSAPPQYLSETSVIAAVGVATKVWHGITGWAEAGLSLNYLSRRKDLGRAIPDYRGGVAYAKGFGTLLTGAGHGWYAETDASANYLSRFQNDTLLYSQTRSGYTLPGSEKRGLQGQIYWNLNATTDLKRQVWANTIETGPGARLRVPMLPSPVVLSVDLLRGSYLIRDDSPLHRPYHDLRFGVWYAFTR